jgi:probable DNA metabolism protein
MPSWTIHFDAESPRDALLAMSALVSAGIDPGRVRWRERGRAQDGLFDAQEAPEPLPGERKPFAAFQALPDGFLVLCRAVAMHCDESRFLKLHRFASALAGDPHIWHDTLDPRRLELEGMMREVRREIHKMHAFVRFRAVGESEELRHIAWFEPTHYVVRAAVPFFVRRFAAMRWTIVTPRISAEWDGERVSFGPGGDRSQRPAPDAGEALWLAYYRAIFNPSRVKTAAMAREMPKRYWRNLPETEAVSQLLLEAPARSARMCEQAEEVRRRLPSAGIGTNTGSSARTSAEKAPDERLERLAQLAKHCSECRHAAAATQTVWGEGQAGARLMIVGEQPGDHEDLSGRPFTGPAGSLLRQAFAALGWPMEQIYLTNAVKHFKFELRGKRRIHKTPGQIEADACAQWLEAEIAAVDPPMLLALGSTAATSLLGRPVSVSASAGFPLTRPDGRIVWVVHHPAAILRRAESGAPSAEAWIASLRRIGEVADLVHSPAGLHPARET